MKNVHRLKTLAATSAVVLLMAGCGSSSDDSTPPTQTPPPVGTMAQEDAAASNSVPGLIAFIQGLIASLTSDTNEPRNVGGITPPVTETAEPAAI